VSIASKRANFVEFKTSLSAVSDPFDHLASQLLSLGITGFFYGFSNSIRISARQRQVVDMFHKHTYGAQWERLVGPKAVEMLDPSIATMLSGQELVEWSVHDYHYPMLSPEQRRIIDIEHRLGIRFGVSAVLDDDRGRFAGVGLWFGQANSHHEFTLQWAEVGTEALMLCRIFDNWLRSNAANILIKLTQREIECLAWLAHGQRPAEICHQLAISEKTFEKHIAAAKQKLRCSTRDQALAKAVVFGIL
jgi:DNA-binding CsgD family transcriptional regulator